MATFQAHPALNPGALAPRVREIIPRGKDPEDTNSGPQRWNAVITTSPSQAGIGGLGVFFLDIRVASTQMPMMCILCRGERWYLLVCTPACTQSEPGRPQQISCSRAGGGAGLAARAALGMGPVRRKPRLRLAKSHSSPPRMQNSILRVHRPDLDSVVRNSSPGLIGEGRFKTPPSRTTCLPLFATRFPTKSGMPSLLVRVQCVAKATVRGHGRGIAPVSCICIGRATAVEHPVLGTIELSAMPHMPHVCAQRGATTTARRPGC